MTSTFKVSRSQMLSFRRATGNLDRRLPAGAASIRTAAWAGLQDSVPRAALLSLHARVLGCRSSDWEHKALVQLWGPHYKVYVVAAQDLAVFSLGRMPIGAKGQARAEDTAEQIQTALGKQQKPFGEVGHLMGVVPNSLRYAATTGIVLLRWDGARQPVIRTVPPPEMTAEEARLELARRYLHIFGPGTPASFSRWAGVTPAAASTVFKQLAAELAAVATPLGDRWILAKDEALLRAEPRPAETTRLLPSGDAFFLGWKGDRTLLVPDAKHRAELWTTRVWPGALLIKGEIAGTWRRSATAVSIHPWRSLTSTEKDSVEEEVRSLPLPGLKRPATLRWD